MISAPVCDPSSGDYLSFVRQPGRLDTLCHSLLLPRYSLRRARRTASSFIASSGETLHRTMTGSNDPIVNRLEFCDSRTDFIVDVRSHLKRPPDSQVRRDVSLKDSSV
jgi:hypothetical protein